MTDETGRSVHTGIRRPALRIAVGVLAAAGTYATPALAHGDGGNPLHGVVLPAAVFLIGVIVLGASVLLDARDVLDRRLADGGVALGAICVIASIGIFWL